MSEDTDFLARWSRRKNRASTDKARQPKSENAPGDIVSGASPALVQDENRMPFDPASLPSLESISAESNIRAFLEAGVPDDLARAALRRVWSLDPAIRDFVGLSENSWDFNAPGAMAGFGPIDGEEVGRLLTRLLGEPHAVAAAEHPFVMSLEEDSQKSAGESDPVEYKATNVESVAQVSAKGQQSDFNEIGVDGNVAQPGKATAPQSDPMSSECLEPSLRRGHGSALPQIRYAEREDG
jgi:hypothetical protein